jgi:uncharacterized phiE125 gp8 family phage protein
VTAPAVEPLSLADAKSHLRISASDTSEDAYIANLIVAARQFVEAPIAPGLDIAIVTQVWDLFFDEFPSSPLEYIDLSPPPLQSVVSVRYTDVVNGLTTITLPNAAFIVDGGVARDARLVAATGWPTASLPRADGVVVRIKVGFGDVAAAVPEAMVIILLQLVAAMHRNRGDDPASFVPPAFEYLSSVFRGMGFA